MEFRARLATPRGEIVEGVYSAEDEHRLRRELEEKGLYILSLQAQGGFRVLLPTRTRRRVSREEFLVFNQELATLLKAGMALVPSLDILRQRVANATFKNILDDVFDRVKAGAALSEAFEEHAAMFPPVYAASLMAGERSGNLDSVIRRYVAYEKVVGTVRRRAISALIYPAILVTMMLALVGFIVFRVVPTFADFYASFDKTLPMATQMLVAISRFASGNAWLIVIAVILAAAAIRTMFQSSAYGERIDAGLLKLPWIGRTLRKFATAQLSRTLATLLGGGIPLVNALEIGVRATSNRSLSHELETVRGQVQEGRGFAESLRDRQVFPDVAVKMVEVGESTGALQEMLNSIADFYDEEIETEVGRFMTLIEPILLIIMGIIIAAVVLALYMPIIQLGSVVK